MLTKVLDILMISETKLDDSFPEAQFYIEGFRAPFRLDRNKHGGGILLYVRNNIDAILLTDRVFPNDTEAFFTEIKEILANGCYVVHITLIELTFLPTFNKFRKR